MPKTAFLGLVLCLCLASQNQTVHADANCELKILGVKAAVAHKWDAKTLVFDTNVMLNDPQAIYKYPGARIIVSGTVLEELDSKKNDPRLGKAARGFSREILNLIERHKATEDIPLGSGATLTLDYKDYGSELANTTLDKKKKDNELLGLALAYGKQLGTDKVVVISDDLNVRIKSYGLKIEARPFELDWLAPPPVKLAGDLVEFEITDAQMAAFLRDGSIAKPDALAMSPNEFVTFKSPGTAPSEKTVGRLRFNRQDPAKLQIHALPNFVALPFQPLNLEQAMALDVLLDPTIDCVILEAKAGTGKTFLTLMAALQLKEKKTYSRILVTKPTVYMGHNNPGALPGGIAEKYSEWMKPYLDNLSTLLSAGKNGKKGGGGPVIQDLPQGFELLAFEFMRGRSIPNALIVVDESQNTNIHEIKTILTRAGENSKMVLMGDATQIDVSPNFLNATNNGLTVASSLLTDPNLPMDKRSRVARVHLHLGVRSGLADMASDVFEQPIPLD